MPPRRIALIGNSLPRRCGIATFTTDLQRAISNSGPNLQASVVAMTDHGQTYDYPAPVVLQIRDDNLQDYARAAALLERSISILEKTHGAISVEVATAVDTLAEIGARLMKWADAETKPPCVYSLQA